MILFLDDSGVEDAHIVNGAVIIIGENFLDLFYDIQSFDDFSKYGILSVKMG